MVRRDGRVANDPLFIVRRIFCFLSTYIFFYMYRYRYGLPDMDVFRYYEDSQE